VTPDSSGSLVYVWEGAERHVTKAVSLDMQAAPKEASDVIAPVIDGERRRLRCGGD
jgi:hypothetical protein